MKNIKEVLVENEEIIFYSNPSYKVRKDYLTWVSIILVIIMEISIYISIRQSLYYLGLKVFIIVFFAVEDLYLFFSLRSKRFNKIRYQKDLFYCLTNKRIFIYNVESNSLMIENLDKCDNIVSRKLDSGLYDVEFYNNGVKIMMFNNISSDDVVEKAKRAKEELKK